MLNKKNIFIATKKANIRYNINEPLDNKINLMLDFCKIALEMSKINNVLLVKYEKLCNQPGVELRKICILADIEFESQMINFKTDLGHTVMGNRMRFDKKTLIKEDLSWVEELSSDEKKLIRNNKKLLSLYSELNYKNLQI